MAANDFLVFGGGAGANVITQVTYSGLTARTAGFSSGVAQSAQLNKVWRQSSIMAAVLAQFIADLTAQDVIDDGTVSTILANLKAGIGAQAPALVGALRNGRMSVAAASATATFTADEAIVKSGLGLKSYCLSSFSQSINLATVGAGGMDVGAAPANGYVAFYAAYNPTTNTRTIFGQNATAAAAPEVYGGANAPAGFTATSLVSVWPTNASGQLVPGFQKDRHISLAAAAGVYTTAQTNAPVTLPVPKNAIVATLGVTQSVASAASNLQFAAGASTPVIGGLTTINAVISGSGLLTFSQSGEAWLLTPQTIYITWVVNGGTSPSLNLSVSGYTF